MSIISESHVSSLVEFLDQEQKDKLREELGEAPAEPELKHLEILIEPVEKLESLADFIAPGLKYGDNLFTKDNFIKYLSEKLPDNFNLKLQNTDVFLSDYTIYIEIFKNNPNFDQDKLIKTYQLSQFDAKINHNKNTNYKQELEVYNNNCKEYYRKRDSLIIDLLQEKLNSTESSKL